MSPGLRLMIYDRTCRGRAGVGLTTSWQAGAVLYRGLGRLDEVRGVASWAEGLEWLADISAGRPIAEIQFWGHGQWGAARVGAEALDVTALRPGHAHHARLLRIRERISPDGLWWFRTCSTFGTAAGHIFARAWADFFRCRVAGHTYVIWLAQSGLHVLAPGETPAWSVEEGLRAEGVSAGKARWSLPGAPNTISCFGGRVPERFRRG